MNFRSRETLRRPQGKNRMRIQERMRRERRRMEHSSTCAH